MSEREPDASTGRQTRVNPKPQPPTAAHALHDRLLVVRFIDGDDLDGDETASARSLLASCPDCAALASDVGIIARATALSTTPSRPRDFRISQPRAEQLRGGTLRRLLDRIAAPGLGALRPLAGSAVAVGLVLVVVGAALPGFTLQRAPAADRGELNAATSAAASGRDGAGQGDFRSAVSPEVMPPLPSGAGALERAPNGVAPQAFGSENDSSDASPKAFLAMHASPAPCSTEGTTAEVGGPAASAQHDTAPQAPTVAAKTTPDATGDAIFVLGILLAVTGLAVLVLSWLARRVSSDPLIR